MKHTPGPWKISELNERYIIDQQYYKENIHPIDFQRIEQAVSKAEGE